MVQQIVTIVNQSGKIVKSTKQLANVFKEAQSAYNEKKAELKAQRHRDFDSKASERKVHKQLEALALDDDANSQRRSSVDGSRIKRKPVASRHERPTIERGVSDSFYVNDERSPKTKTLSRSSTMQFDAHGRAANDDPRVGELVRRHTDLDKALASPRSRRSSRRASLDDIDMDLAYGELPPPLPARKGNDTVELRDKMTGLQRLLEEANCVGHSATAIIENLSKNPDTMAAVALTLGEISALAAKVAPGALTALKGSFPAILALLASPQFAIAAGVGVGITIIAFGSYKIIKKIQARGEEDSRLLAYEAEPLSPTESVDELREINRIESWRRGIADVEAESLATSVEGEFITPIATRTLIEEGRLTEADLKSKASTRKSRRRKSASDVSKSSKAKSSSKTGGKSTRSKKEKPPSRLAMLFKA
ncbi:hypothetical protein AMS68_007492 [Peltaster fructicola]|uniref:Uncharacterized protein n=1 Tax=Peltaster fructicola TaxID=286661 RepID=A0A6H0Y4Z0_9PEZI|nr:hypothetical protein AMS68_007492 [Peltaster fructicola]